MKKYKVGLIGATGMVGQRFVSLMENHPWFELAAVAASSRSAGKKYEEAISGRWQLREPVPESLKKLTLLSAESDVSAIASSVDFVFSAVDMKKEEIKALEAAYAKAECPVISNNSAHRWTPDVPMVIPEVNPEHAHVIESQRKRLRTKCGFIAVKSNCSIQSYVPALHPLKDRFGLARVLVCTYQAISGAGKTFESWPEMVDNVIPHIGGEEEKSEQEPLKIWGEIIGDEIAPAVSPQVTSQCVRIPVTDGHMAAVFMAFRKKPPIDEIKHLWNSFKGRPQELDLPSAPKQFLHYFEDETRPQTGLDRMLEGGMAVSLGRLRPDTQYDYRFIGLSHNTLRGAAGGAVLLAELLCADGYIQKR
ncbi:MAG: aspartate-semialdehyde dehydrogenase [Oscillospiraceae bacterium]|nr:aspartate-semialdehyde dehydrogenase [Oscillospiraceae bacterium]